MNDFKQLLFSSRWRSWVHFLPEDLIAENQLSMLSHPSPSDQAPELLLKLMETIMSTKQRENKPLHL